MKNIILICFMTFVSCDHHNFDFQSSDVSLISSNFHKYASRLSRNAQHLVRDIMSSNYISSGNEQYNDLIKNALNWLKIFMKRGNTVYKIPQLDPYSFRKNNIVFEDAVKLVGNLDGTVENLSSFTVENVYSCLFSMVFQINVVIPKTKISGNYDLDGSINEIIPLYGSGSYSFEIEKLNVTLTTQLNYQRSAEPLNVQFLKINLNSLAGAKLDFGKALGGGPLAEILNTFSTDASLVITERLVGSLENYFSQVIENSLSKSAKSLTISQILRFLENLPHYQ